MASLIEHLHPAVVVALVAYLVHHIDRVASVVIHGSKSDTWSRMASSANTTSSRECPFLCDSGKRGLLTGAIHERPAPSWPGKVRRSERLTRLRYYPADMSFRL